MHLSNLTLLRDVVAVRFIIAFVVAPLGSVFSLSSHRSAPRYSPIPCTNCSLLQLLLLICTLSLTLSPDKQQDRREAFRSDSVQLLVHSRP